MNFFELLFRSNNSREIASNRSWNATSIEVEAREIVAELLDYDSQTITPETLLYHVDDSVGSLEIVMQCEETFDIDISDADTEKLVTFAHLVEYLCSRLLEIK